MASPSISVYKKTLPFMDVAPSNCLANECMNIVLWQLCTFTLYSVIM